jgi:hypothetical protein
MSETAAVRKRKQRESGRAWLREHFGVTPDALVTALKNGWIVARWVVKRPERKVRSDKLSKGK